MIFFVKAMNKHDKVYIYVAWSDKTGLIDYLQVLKYAGFKFLKVVARQWL